MFIFQPACRGGKGKGKTEEREKAGEGRVEKAGEEDEEEVQGVEEDKMTRSSDRAPISEKTDGFPVLTVSMDLTGYN